MGAVYTRKVWQLTAPRLGDHNQTRVDLQSRNLDRTADIFRSIRIRKSQVTVQAMTNVVPVKQIRMPPKRGKPLLEKIGQGSLSGAGESGEPGTHRFMVFQRLPYRLIHRVILPNNFGALIQKMLSN